MRTTGSLWQATFPFKSMNKPKEEWFLTTATRTTPAPIKNEGEYNDAGDNASTTSEESSIQCQEVPEYGPDDFNPWQFMQALPPYQNVRHNCPGGEFLLPPKPTSAAPITLVLDLDETLVHSSPSPVEDPDLVFPVTSTNTGDVFQVYVRYRPFLFQFLEAIHDKFEVVLFTASQACYADELLNRIDPEGKYFQHRLFRESCVPIGVKLLKDLSILGRDLSRTILVDNSPHTFGYQVDNGIPIESWYDDPTDRELLKLERFLELYCLDVQDVRPALRFKFGCQKLVDDAPPSLELYQAGAALAIEDEDEEGEPGEVHC